MQRDVVHRARPGQEGIRRIRRALVTVATTLHHQPELVATRKVDGGRHILGGSRGHGASAGLGAPGVGPAAGLGQRNVVADVVGVLQALEDGGAGRLARVGRTSGKWGAYFDQPIAQLLFELLPLRRGRPAGVTGPNAAESGLVGLGLGRGGRHQRHSSDQLHELAPLHGYLLGSAPLT